MSIIANSSASRTGFSASGSAGCQEDDLRLLGHRGEDRGKDVALCLHAERRVVVLVQHEAFDALLLGVDVIARVLVIEPAAGEDRNACSRTSAPVWPASSPISAG
jgi:hypothetical protein